MLHGDFQIDTLTWPDVKKTTRGQGIEARRIRKQLDSFDAKSSEVWGILQTKFSSGVTHKELLSIAEIICMLTGGHLTLGRSERRDARVLIKWFSQNWFTVKPFIDRMHIFDSNFCEVNLAREVRETGKGK